MNVSSGAAYPAMIGPKPTLLLPRWFRGLRRLDNDWAVVSEAVRSKRATKHETQSASSHWLQKEVRQQCPTVVCGQRVQAQDLVLDSSKVRYRREVRKVNARNRKSVTDKTFGLNLVSLSSIVDSHIGYCCESRLLLTWWLWLQIRLQALKPVAGKSARKIPGQDDGERNIDGQMRLRRVSSMIP